MFRNLLAYLCKHRSIQYEHVCIHALCNVHPQNRTNSAVDTQNNRSPRFHYDSCIRVDEDLVLLGRFGCKRSEDHPAHLVRKRDQLRNEPWSKDLDEIITIYFNPILQN